MTRYAIIYGGLGRSDYIVEGPYTSIQECRDNYSADKRIKYMDGLTGGAAIVEYNGSPGKTIETLAEDQYETI